MDLSLKGKQAVVCGSSQGIGLAIAQELALLGTTCILLARNEARLQEAVKKLDTASGQKHFYAVADFADTLQVKNAIDNIVSKQRIHILVNNTGGPAAGPVTEATTEQFTNAFQQHLVNNQLLTQAVLPGMKQADYGRIINVISTSVKIPLPNLGVSNTIRGAVASWAKTMANELGQFNITVNNILPGYTLTQRLEKLTENTAAKSGQPVAAVEEKMKDSIPMKRFGTPEELGAVAAFLASPAASYVNGVSIPVDGGRTGSI